MADVATPSAIDMSMGPSATDTTEKSQKTKPEKPDEAKYKEDLSKAEKEHAAAQEKLVLSHFSHSSNTCCLFTAPCMIYIQPYTDT